MPDPEWAAWPTGRRAERLHRLLDELTIPSWFGANLRKLRSRAIEEALATA